MFMALSGRGFDLGDVGLAVRGVLLWLDADAEGVHFSCRSVTENMACDLEDCSFMSVAPVARF